MFQLLIAPLFPGLSSLKAVEREKSAALLAFWEAIRPIEAMGSSLALFSSNLVLIAAQNTLISLEHKFHLKMLSFWFHWRPVMGDGGAGGAGVRLETWGLQVRAPAPPGPVLVSLSRLLNPRSLPVSRLASCMADPLCHLCASVNGSVCQALWELVGVQKCFRNAVHLFIYL